MIGLDLSQLPPRIRAAIVRAAAAWYPVSVVLDHDELGDVLTLHVGDAGDDEWWTYAWRRWQGRATWHLFYSTNGDVDGISLAELWSYTEPLTPYGASPVAS